MNGEVKQITPKMVLIEIEGMPDVWLDKAMLRHFGVDTEQLTVGMLIGDSETSK